jgi:hypothetical protein
VNSDRVNRWLTLAANVGVIGGLLLVALQLRQTTTAILGATYQAGAESSAEWNKWVVEQVDLIPAAMRFRDSGRRDGLSAADQFRLEIMMMAAFRRLDGMFYQHELGLLGDDYYETLFKADMETWVPRWRDWGLLNEGSQSYVARAMRPSFRAEVQKYMDAPRPAFGRD